MWKLTIFGVITLLTCAYAFNDNCHMEELQECQSASPTLNSTVYYADTREDWDKICVELHAFTNCLENYLRRCVERYAQIVFRKTYSGVNNFIQQVCTPGPYQNEYLQHAKCVKSIGSEYEMCTMKYEASLAVISEPPKTEQTESQFDFIKTVCCSYHERLICSENTVQRSCGEQAAIFTISIMKTIAPAMMNICNNYNEESCGSNEQDDKGSQTNLNLLMIGVFMLANLFSIAKSFIVFAGFTYYVQNFEDYII